VVVDIPAIYPVRTVGEIGAPGRGRSCDQDRLVAEPIPAQGSCYALRSSRARS
jgi:hypothetical protein